MTAQTETDASAGATGTSGPFVLGVDSGGSGLRVALGNVGMSAPVGTTVCAEPVRTGPAGIDAGHLLEQLLPAVHAAAGAARQR